MPSSTSSSDRRPWPWALLLALALFATAEHALWGSARWLGFVGRHTPAGPAGDAARSLSAIGLLPRDPVPVVLLGSSQFREGLDCAAFARSLPDHPCTNLAISAGAPLDLLEIDRRLDARAPRRIVVAGLFPKLLGMPVKAGFVGGGTLAALAASGAWRHLPREQWMDLAAGLLQDLSPTLRAKDGLWELYVHTGRRPRAAWDGRLPPAPSRLLRADEPPMPPEYFATRIGRIDDDAEMGPATPAQEEATQRLVRRELALGNRLLVVDFPTRPGYETTVPPATRERYARLLDRLRATPGLCFVEAAQLGPLDVDDFQDFTHLAARGRARVSERLAAALARCISGLPAGPPIGQTPPTEPDRLRP